MIGSAAASVATNTPSVSSFVTSYIDEHTPLVCIVVFFGVGLSQARQSQQ
jgi:hypothetical protein